MSNRKFLALAPVALAAMACLPASAAEFGSVDMLYAGPSTIEVVSNGQAYTGTAIPLVRIAGRARLRLDPGVSGRVKTWSVWPEVLLPHGSPSQLQFGQDKTSRSYGTGDRPKTVDQEIQVALSPESTRQTAMAACAGRLAHLRSTGKSDAEIFRQDQVVKVTVQALLSYEFSGVQGVQPAPEASGAAAPSVDIVCKGSRSGVDGAAVGGGIPANTPALLQSANISLLHPSGPTRCPANVTAHMTFRADASQPPGYVQYRVRSVFGHVSAPTMVKFEASDRNGSHYVKSVQQNFQVGGQPAPGSSGLGGPLGTHQAGSGLAAPQRPDNDGVVRPQGPAGQTVGGGLAATPSNVHKDAMFIEVTTAAPGSVMKSENAEYTVTCDTSVVAPVGGGAAGGVRATPVTPPPRPTGEAQPASPPPSGKADPSSAPQPPARPGLPPSAKGAGTDTPQAAPAAPLPGSGPARLAAPAASQPRR